MLKITPHLFAAKPLLHIYIVVIYRQIKNTSESRKVGKASIIAPGFFTDLLTSVLNKTQ